MDKSIINDPHPLHAGSTRSPDWQESGLGLWLDRTGQATDGPREHRLRLLHNYGVLQVCRGNGSFYSPPSGWLRLSPGDCVWLLPEVPHFYGADEEWNTRWIVFRGFVADRFVDAGYVQAHIPRTEHGADLFAAAFRALRDNRRLEPSARALGNFQALTDLLSGLCRLAAVRPATHHKLEAVLAYIREHCAQPLSPAAIAERFQVSHSHLRRLVRDETGGSLRQFITEERLANAKALLLDTNLPPKQIAEAVGYPDYLYFMRVFKKQTGLTAGSFRNRALRP